MVVRFSQDLGGMEGGKEVFPLSPLVMEEGRGGRGGGGGGLHSTSPSKRSLIEYYNHMNFDHYLQADKRPSSGGCMASAWRVISFFVVVFVLPTVLISLPLYARYHLYHARHLPMTETDTRALNHAVSSFWCQGQRVSSNGTLDAFLVAGAPRMRKEKRHVTLKRRLTLQHDDIEYWGVYLLQGSTFTVSSTARWPGGVLLVAQGEENLRKCFYREEHLEAQLNEAPPAKTSVYRSPPDVDDLGGEMAIEEEHHWGDTGGGEVFGEEEEGVVLEGFIRQSTEHLKEKEVKEDTKDVPRHKYNLKGKGSEAPKRRNGKGKKGRKGKKRRNNKNETHRHRSKRSQPEIPSTPSPLPSLSSPVPPSTPSSYPPSLSLSPDNLDMLHRFNDTMGVTTGNSSFSSSEEFLEQCRDSILVVDLQPSLNWEIRIGPDSPNSWTFTVNSSDYFYFIFTSDNSIELNHMGFQLDLHRAIYDVSSPLEVCRNSTECVFPLAFTQTEAVVVEVPAQEDLLELHSFEVTTACQPRVPVYMVFFLLVPFIILLFAFQ